MSAEHPWEEWDEHDWRGRRQGTDAEDERGRLVEIDWWALDGWEPNVDGYHARLTLPNGTQLLGDPYTAEVWVIVIVDVDGVRHG